MHITSAANKLTGCEEYYFYSNHCNKSPEKTFETVSFNNIYWLLSTNKIMKNLHDIHEQSNDDTKMPRNQ